MHTYRAEVYLVKTKFEKDKEKKNDPYSLILLRTITIMDLILYIAKIN